MNISGSSLDARLIDTDLQSVLSKLDDRDNTTNLLNRLQSMIDTLSRLIAGCVSHITGSLDSFHSLYAPEQAQIV